MIKFFGRIRHKLLSENKVSKYILYAIGEIFLVVIGILIALQINNWNEERKAKSKTIIYVNKIINDLENDLRNLDSLYIIGNTNRQQAANYFEKFENQKGIPLINRIKTSKVTVSEMSKFRYTPIDYTFRDMQSSGNSTLLSEDQRNAMIKLSNTQDFTLIVLEKDILDIMDEESKSRSLLDHDRSVSEFFENIGVERDQNTLAQGLLYQHNVISLYDNLGENINWLGERIKKETKVAIDLLKNTNTP